ncbi:MAG: hypothetical protein KAI66_19370 [Lentisphaeria bacterium]|nr:hypothetical protein [Lentisphaeria bacterium]
MTVRAILLGFLGAGFVCGASFFNDRILRQSYLVGNNMPVSVYGALIFFVILVNPYLRKLHLKGSELAVILTLTLAACCIPGSGFLRTFTSSILLPYHYEKVEPGWRDQKVVQMLPKRMLADVTDEDEVLGTFVQGIGEGSQHASWRDIPWAAWKKPFLLWIPLILTLWFGLIGLSVYVHRQWSSHEHLPYPIASFANALLPDEESGRNSLFRKRIFWFGLGAVLFIHMNNYLCQWFPQTLIPIATRFSFAPMARFFPTITRGGGWAIFHPRIFFCVVGIAFLIPTDLSLTFGIGPTLWAIVVGTFAVYGINLNNVIEGSYWYTGLKARMFILFGANVGLFLALMYTGRHYYWTILKRAFGGRGGGDADAGAVWGCRAFLVMMVCFVVQLSLAGLDWQLAVIYTGILVIFYVVMSRIICESGLFHLQSNIFPCTIIWGFFGASSLGPGTLLMMQVISMILVCDPRESLMPFMSNSLKVMEMRKGAGGGMGRVSLWCVGAILVGLAIALPLTLYIQYDQGNACWEGWAEKAVPTMQFTNAVAVKRKLTNQGLLESSQEASGWGRFGQMKPNSVCMTAFAAGIVLVLLFSAARLRFRWWPLHPLLFVTWCTTHIQAFSGSFLLGWLIKRCVVKYGGNAVYNRMKPLVYGLIAGEILSAVIPSIVGVIYYFVTGNRPKAFHVLLG